MLVGSHLSIAGGLHLAVEEAVRLGLDCVQVFTKNQRQWKVRPLQETEIAAFRAAVRTAGWEGDEARRLVSHNSYLVNLASPDAEARARSAALQREEIERCEALGIPSCVMHPGAHLGEKGSAKDEEDGLRRLAKELDALHAATRGYRTVTCLENTVGSGTNLGGPFEHLARVRSLVRAPERVAVCVDTCHATAYGHDMSTPGGARAVWAAFDAVVGMDALRVLHVNDSKGALGSHLDRHEHLGNGACGRACFEHIARGKAFADVPCIMETPKEGRLRRQEPDRANAAWLRACAALALACAAVVASGGCRPWAAPAGEYAAAERSLPAEPTPEQRARMQAAQEVAARGEYRQALVEFREVLAENPRIPQAHVAIAGVQIAAGDLRAAERAFEAALRIDPRNVEARRGLAQIYAQTGRANDALREYQRALVDAPADRASQAGIARILTQRGDTAAAVPFLRSLADGRDGTAQDWVNLGVACLATGQPQEAAGALEEALALGQSGPEVLAPLAEAYAAQGRYGEAASTAEALARRVSTAAAWERVGWLQFRQDDYARSAQAYRRATELEPESARAWNGVAITALNAWLLSDRLDQAAREEARRALNRSLEIQPDQPAMERLRATYRP
jgi:deoxyribonuclease-4